ncbi:MAG: PilZ domain-containing protein [Rhodoplanes sp.]|uniref:PilZ domain-containing protein n=1 Tax=Rhodoplanes sp. TaxID=1968906 RepID=UPI001804C31B|nr:PilZ domain-containing protein [Rhodoplanes sp.]NVO14121.1 PilZ domain-containing protein [Rhodoplanes sp.]
MQDRRREQRWPAYLRGRISFADRFAAVDCLIRNTSATGARLAVHNGVFVPDEFDLAIPRKSTEVRVRARWRTVDAIGVEIADPPAADAPIPISLARRIRELEAANEALERRLHEET